MDLIAYYRVSTDRQGRSGLGLEAQQERVAQLAAERGAQVVAEFVEVESGRKSDRPQLAAALAEARKRKAVVAVAKQKWSSLGVQQCPEGGLQGGSLSKQEVSSLY